MASSGGLSGLALAYLSIGGLMVYSGIEDISPTSALKAVLSGKAPAPGKQTNQLSATETADILGAGDAFNSSGLGLGGSATGASVAQDAQTYAGKVPYVSGGGQPSTGWDCSGFVNYVLGHDFSLELPGNTTWNGNGYSGGDGGPHGPVVASYVVWTGGTIVPNSQVQAGDLICYPPNVHMGIAISATQLVAAEQPDVGTGVADIGGWLPYIVVRPNAYETGAQLSSGAGAAASGQTPTGGSSSGSGTSSGSSGTSSGGTWWVAVTNGSFNAYVISAPNRAAANQEAKGTNGSIDFGPYATKAKATAVANSWNKGNK